MSRFYSRCPWNQYPRYISPNKFFLKHFAGRLKRRNIDLRGLHLIPPRASLWSIGLRTEVRDGFLWGEDFGNGKKDQHLQRNTKGMFDGCVVDYNRYSPWWWKLRNFISWDQINRLGARRMTKFDNIGKAQNATWVEKWDRKYGAYLVMINVLHSLNQLVLTEWHTNICCVYAVSDTFCKQLVLLYTFMFAYYNAIPDILQIGIIIPISKMSTLSQMDYIIFFDPLHLVRYMLKWSNKQFFLSWTSISVEINKDTNKERAWNF